MKTLSRLGYLLLALEFLLLCVCLPSVIIYNVWARYMFFFLWGAAGYCLLHIIVFRRKDFFKDIWKWDVVTWGNMKPISVRWVLAVIAMILFIYFYDPDRMFEMTRSRPYFLFVLFVLYPILSALPQELIFCSFFFHRYAPFFRHKTTRIIMSAVVFAYAHVLYINAIAPTLSFIGGLIFAQTYAKTRSLALVTIEHSLYGNALFLVGLGWYFYSGAVVTSH